VADGNLKREERTIYIMSLTKS